MSLIVSGYIEIHFQKTHPLNIHLNHITDAIATDKLKSCGKLVKI